MTNPEEKDPDVSVRLFEIDDGWRAMPHGRTGVQPTADPVRESERLAAAWRGLDAFARPALLQTKE